MKLSELKVGMTVTRAQWPSSRRVEVLGIGNKTLFFRDNNGDELLYSDEEGWIIVEPRRKPSEDVEQYMTSCIYYAPNYSPRSGFRDLAQYANARIDAILKYLDEQASEQK